MIYRRREGEGEGGHHVLGVTLGVDRARIPTDAFSQIHFVAEVRATAEGVERERPPLSLVFVIDVSGSMAGPPLEQVMLSIDRMVGLLEPSDRVGVVAFSDNATEVVSVRPVTSEAKARVRARVHRLHADGHTNIESGLRRAAAMLPPRGPHERQVLLVLSDGVPNRGLASPDEIGALAKSYRPDISISTLGYGAHHHEDTLTSISSSGGGRYHYIADPSVCDFEFAQAIGTQGDVVAEAVELTLAPVPGVEFVRFLGKPQTRFGAQGIVVSLPDMLDGSTHLTVAEIMIRAPREPHLYRILQATLSYKKAGERAALSIERDVSVEVGAHGGALVPAVNAQVLRVRCDDVRAEARALADRGQFDGAAALLRHWIKAVEQAPGFSANDGSPLAEAYELLIDEATAMERKPSMEDYRTFRRTSMGSSLSLEAPLSMMPRSSTIQSRSIMANVAGKYPKAHLEMLDGPDAGKKTPLGPRQILGRTQAADIRVTHASVSRQHTQIVAQAGKFFVVDLGSTNTTEVNGERIVAPRKLAPGDILRVGEIKLRYVED
jgi:Ca-activated chloride channel family protein